MKNPYPSEPEAADLPPDPPELQVALKAVAQDLTRDLDDTGDNLRDALDLAPIALVKGASAIARVVTRPRVVILSLALLGAAAAIIALRRQRARARKL